MDEEKREIYEGAEKDVVLSIPKNTVEIKIELTTFENGEAYHYSRIMDIEAINEAEDIFEDTIRGDYPYYVFNEDALREMGEQRLSDDEFSY